jgi:excinuclease UvrABC ATPase subunit
MKYSENYIDHVMKDGRARTARQVIDEIITFIEETPGKVSFAYVPEQRKVSHYLRTNKQYVLIEENRKTGNSWAVAKIKCKTCDGTGNMIDMPCNDCEGLGEIDNELD